MISAAPFIRSVRWIAPTVAFSLVSASCTENPSALNTGPGAAKAKQFSAEDKRAARALSIGNAGALAETATPYDSALRCSLVFTDIAERFEGFGNAGGQQQRAMAQAQLMFDERLRGLATQAGRTAQQVESDRANLDVELPEGAERARIAIGCIRQLQAQAAKTG